MPVLFDGAIGAIYKEEDFCGYGKSVALYKGTTYI
jgi:hypothetical protein